MRASRLTALMFVRTRAVAVADDSSPITILEHGTFSSVIAQMYEVALSSRSSCLICLTRIRHSRNGRLALLLLLVLTLSPCILRCVRATSVAHLLIDRADA